MSILFRFVNGGQDLSRILHYKNMGQEALWLDCAEKLTTMIQNIIEFAKLIPGFMRLSQDDQVRHLLFDQFNCCLYQIISHTKIVSALHSHWTDFAAENRLI